jgi:hypothetical protein
VGRTSLAAINEDFMTDNCIAATATPFAHVLSVAMQWSIALGAFLTVLADWLFFRQSVRISLALFVMAVGVSVFGQPG